MLANSTYLIESALARAQSQHTLMEKLIRNMRRLYLWIGAIRECNLACKGIGFGWNTSSTGATFAGRGMIGSTIYPAQGR